MTADRDVADYFETAVAASQVDHQAVPKLLANWVTSELAGRLNKSDQAITACPVSAVQLAGLVDKIADNTISGKIAKQVFDAMWDGEGMPIRLLQHVVCSKLPIPVRSMRWLMRRLVPTHSSVSSIGRARKNCWGFCGAGNEGVGGKANPAQLNALLKEKLG